MVHRIARAFHFSEGIVIAPVDSGAATRAGGELLEQKFMDQIVAKRHFLRFVFVALGAILCLKVALAEASTIPDQIPSDLCREDGTGRHVSAWVACDTHLGTAAPADSRRALSALEEQPAPLQ